MLHSEIFFTKKIKISFPNQEIRENRFLSQNTDFLPSWANSLDCKITPILTNMDKKLSLLSQLFAITGTEVGAVRTEPSEHSTEDYAQTSKTKLNSRERSGNGCAGVSTCETKEPTDATLQICNRVWSAQNEGTSLLNSDLYFKSSSQFQDSTHKVFWSSQLQLLMLTVYLWAEVALQMRIPRLQMNENVHSN